MLYLVYYNTISFFNSYKKMLNVIKNVINFL